MALVLGVERNLEVDLEEDPFELAIPSVDRVGMGSSEELETKMHLENRTKTKQSMISIDMSIEKVASCLR